MSEITLLDGSIGQELVKRTGERATPLWSTQVMIDHPEAVGAVHADYFAAGATIASTNTYALHHNRLARVGLEGQLDALRAVAVAQARAARESYPAGRIAGCLGPMLASYRPDLAPDLAEAEAQFDQMAAFLAPDVDILLAETVCSVQEAQGVLRGITGHGKPVWIAFSVQDDDGTRLRSGEALSAILPLVARHKPDAVLINCSRPEAIGAGLPVLAQTGLPFGAYGNGFVEISEGFLKDNPTVDALRQRVDLTPDAYADIAMSWLDQGATILGGCCEVGPAHITEIARRLRAAGHTIV